MGYPVAAVARLAGASQSLRLDRPAMGGRRAAHPIMTPRARPRPSGEARHETLSAPPTSTAGTTATRSEALPDIPAVGDFVPGYEATEWAGVGVPKNTPGEIINKLNKEINAGLADPKMKARLADLGGTVLPGSPADFGRFIAAETEKWGKVTAAAPLRSSIAVSDRLGCSALQASCGARPGGHCSSRWRRRAPERHTSVVEMPATTEIIGNMGHGERRPVFLPAPPSRPRCSSACCVVSPPPARLWGGRTLIANTGKTTYTKNPFVQRCQKCLRKGLL
jgi:hypothetical protein